MRLRDIASVSEQEGEMRPAEAPRGVHVRLKVRVLKGGSEAIEQTIFGYPRLAAEDRHLVALPESQDAIFWLDKLVLARFPGHQGLDARATVWARNSAAETQVRDSPFVRSEECLFGVMPDVFRSWLSRFSIDAGYPPMFFAPHDLRRGWVTSAVLKAYQGKRADEVTMTSVAETLRMLNNWKGNEESAFWKYLVEALRRNLSSTGFVHGVGDVVLHQQIVPERFHGLLKDSLRRQERPPVKDVSAQVRKFVIWFTRELAIRDPTLQAMATEQRRHRLFWLRLRRAVCAPAIAAAVARARRMSADPAAGVGVSLFSLSQAQAKIIRAASDRGDKADHQTWLLKVLEKSLPTSPSGCAETAFAKLGALAWSHQVRSNDWRELSGLLFETFAAHKDVILSFVREVADHHDVVAASQRPVDAMLRRHSAKKSHVPMTVEETVGLCVLCLLCWNDKHREKRVRSLAKKTGIARLSAAHCNVGGLLSVLLRQQSWAQGDFSECPTSYKIHSVKRDHPGNVEKLFNILQSLQKDYALQVQNLMVKLGCNDSLTSLYEQARDGLNRPARTEADDDVDCNESASDASAIDSESDSDDDESDDSIEEDEEDDEEEGEEEGENKSEEEGEEEEEEEEKGQSDAHRQSPMQRPWSSDLPSSQSRSVRMQSMAAAEHLNDAKRIAGEPTVSSHIREEQIAPYANQARSSSSSSIRSNATMSSVVLGELRAYVSGRASNLPSDVADFFRTKHRHGINVKAFCRQIMRACNSNASNNQQLENQLRHFVLWSKGMMN